MATLSETNVARFGAASSPITGRFLAHNRLSIIERAFLAADLHVGKLQLVQPTVKLSAVIARVNTTYAHAALTPTAEVNRADIVAQRIPLIVPSRGIGPPVHGMPAPSNDNNGNVLPMPSNYAATIAEPSFITVDNAWLAEVIRVAGVARTREVAAMIESEMA